MNIRHDSAVVAWLIETQAIDRLRLIDVGASGGIAAYWSQFGRALAAVGFDPLVNNVKKVAAAEQRPGVHYEAAFVGCQDFDRLLPPKERQYYAQPFQRSSSTDAQELMRMDYVAQVFNEGEPVIWSERNVTLDQFFENDAQWDFLKIDTDGSDFQVILGAERMLTSGEFLGMVVESQFHGWLGDHSNTLTNMDRYLTHRGFGLFDFDRHRYSRRALPALFEYDIPAQTLSGPVVWGDALYFRDLAHPEYQGQWHYQVTREKVLKLVALYDVFGLPDCAAELLLAHPALTSEQEREHLLNLLVASAGFSGTYAEHMARFRTNVRTFFPSAYRQASAASPPPAVAPEVQDARSTNAAEETIVSRLARILRRLPG